MTLPTIKIFIRILYHAENSAQGVGGVFVATDCDGVDAHLDDWIIITARLGHVAKIKDVFFGNVEFF